MVPTANQALSKILLPSRLWLGFALGVAGAALIGGALVLGERISIRLLLFGVSFVVIGVALAVSSHAQACAACKKALESTSTAVPIEHAAAVMRALEAARAGDVHFLIRLATAPFPATTAPVRSSVLLRYCPQCRSVAQLSSAKQKMLPDGATTEHDISPETLIIGPAVAGLVDAIHARNEAWAHAVYAVRAASSGAAR